MSRKVVLLISGFIAVMGLIVVLLINVTKKESTTSPVVENKKESVDDVQVLSETLKEYIDSSGFKFKYPDNFSVSTANQIGENVYSSLTLSSADIEGKTSILVEATNAKSLDDWLLQNAKTMSDKELQKVKLADLDARQYEKDGKIVTIAYDTGVLFSITTDLKPQKEAMLKVNQTILASFAFQPPAESAEATSESSEGDVIFEGEETVE